VRNLDDDLRDAVEAALHDDRFAGTVPIDPRPVAVTVSLLFDPLELGQASPEEIVNYYRHGDQTLMVYQGERVGLLLPFVASTWNLDSVGFAEAVIEKAGLTEPPYNWCRFDCVTWYVGSEGVLPTVGGFVTPDDELPAIDDLTAKHAKLHVRYLLEHLRDDGTFYSRYQPFQNKLYEYVDPARQAHGAWVLSRAQRIYGGDELENAASRVIDNLLAHAVRDGGDTWLRHDDETPSVAEISFLLLALSNLSENDSRRSLIKEFAATLWRCIELPNGRITTHLSADDPHPDAYQDYFPGQVLLALAVACEVNASEIDHERLHRSFKYYRHRFRYKRHFGQVAWLLQAFSKWSQVTRETDFADLVFEIADWLLEYQQDKTGAFINGHQPDTPGYTTAVYLEGIAAALAVADGPRHDTYFNAFTRGFGFLDRLIIQERDESMLPNPDFALGGMRQGIHYSEIRTDFVQHSLSALLESASQHGSNLTVQRVSRFNLARV